MMLKKMFGLVLFLGLFGQKSEAQSLFSAAVVAGGNMSQMTNDASFGYNKVGIHAGFKGIINLAPQHELGIALIYDQRGSRNSTIPNFKINFNHISVPFTFSYKEWYSEANDYFKMHFTAGIEYSRLFQRSQNEDQFPRLIDPECFDNYENNSVSGLLGVSYFFDYNWGITLLHLRSLHSIKSFKSVGECPFLAPYQWTLRLEYKF